MIINSRISITAFCSAVSAFSVVLMILAITDPSNIVRVHIGHVTAIYLLLGAVVLYFHYKRQAFQVAIRAYALGAGFAVGLIIWLLAHSSWVVFGWYLCLLTFFHFSEYFTTSIVNPKTLSLDSFLINHSTEYSVAAVCSWLEFILERWLYPDMKICWMSYIGVTLCIIGEVLRKLAMFTARCNFNHIIQVQREEGHVLVTNGVYSVFRHPSYVGWFWWSVGTQIVLCNPLCLIGYTIASWKFFNARIYEEEITLLNFFGEDYVRYQKRVDTGLPFIKGYRLEL